MSFKNKNLCVICSYEADRAGILLLCGTLSACSAILQLLVDALFMFQVADRHSTVSATGVTLIPMSLLLAPQRAMFCVTSNY
jgi:ABC-type protease/lipase transport system fused ATPase/permease subunit